MKMKKVTPRQLLIALAIVGVIYFMMNQNPRDLQREGSRLPCDRRQCHRSSGGSGCWLRNEGGYRPCVVAFAT